MKNLILLLTMIISLTATHELYAQGNSGKDKSRKEKPERDKPEREKLQKNIKAEDAQQNWGKLKYQYEYLEKSEQKQIKEKITIEKRIRNEIRKEIEKNPDLDLSSISEYDPTYPNDLEKMVRKLTGDHSDGKVNEETLIALKSTGMSAISINKIENSILKYNEYSSILEEKTDKVDSSSEDDE